jgi:hypothetical protein
MQERPSKSALKDELIDAIHVVLTPCILDVDVSVRRGAAQCTGLLAHLLRSSYVDKFLVVAQASVCASHVPSRAMQSI